jgi:hypothetical protein
MTGGRPAGPAVRGWPLTLPSETRRWRGKWNAARTALRRILSDPAADHSALRRLRSLRSLFADSAMRLRLATTPFALSTASGRSRSLCRNGKKNDLAPTDTDTVRPRWPTNEGECHERS